MYGFGGDGASWRNHWSRSLGPSRSFTDLSARQLRRKRELRIDPAASAFFSRRNVREPIISDFGNLLSSEPRVVNGRSVGSVTQMRNLNNLEGRTYTALNTGLGGDGGGYLRQMVH